MGKISGTMLIALILLFIPVLIRPVDHPRTWAYIIHEQDPETGSRVSRINGYAIICVTGFTIDKTGRIHNRGAETVRQLMKKKTGESPLIYPLISFTSPSAGHAILTSPALINSAVNGIRDLVIQNDFPGVHLDFEYLPPADSRALVSLLIKLRKELPHSVLTMAVFPPIGLPVSWSEFHDLKSLAPLLDEIVLMCYDLHRPGTKAGPVTDYSWAEKNIRRALEYAPSYRIWLGIPAYGYRWYRNGKAVAVSARAAVKLAKKHGYLRHVSGNMLIRMESGDIIYVADSFMREKMTALARKYSLRGTALWRLGFEESE
jgi:spore germination protein YaaH